MIVALAIAFGVSLVLNVGFYRLYLDREKECSNLAKASVRLALRVYALEKDTKTHVVDLTSLIPDDGEFKS